MFVAIPGGPAHARQRLRVLVVCTGEISCESFEKRLRGQTSDLPVKLDHAALAPGASVAAAPAAVERLAHERKAQVALWWQEGKVLALLRPTTPTRLYERSVKGPRPSGPKTDTADLEAAALIGRTAILAALNREPLGVPQAPVDAPAPAPPPPPPPPSPAAAPATGPRWRWQASARAGWSLLWDGLPSEPSHGPELRLGARYGPLRFGAMWIERLQVETLAEDARGAIDSRQLGVHASWDFVRLGGFAAGLELRLGRLFSTVTPLSGPLEDPEHYATTTYGAAATFSHQVVPGSLALWLCAAVDRLDQRIIVGVRNSSGFRPMWYMAKHQPTVTLGIEVLFPRSF